MARLRGCLALAWLVAAMLCSFPPSLLSRAAARWCMLRLWARGFLRVAGIRVQVTGPPPAWPAEPALIVANHASLLDIPILCDALGWPPRFVAKVELGRVPLLAFYLRRTGAVLVDRRHARQAARALDDVAARLADGPPFCFFAEGARHADGAVHPFRLGAFQVALRGGAAVLPVAIVGSHEALPPGRLLPRPAVVRVEIAAPMRPEAGEAARPFAERVRAVIGAMHQRIGGAGLAAELHTGFADSAA